MRMIEQLKEALDSDASPSSAMSRRFCLIVFGTVSAVMVALVGRTMLARFFFPYELSKMEGYLIEHMRWFAQGNPIYAAPSEFFIPFLYTPLMYWAGASLMSLGMDGFTAGRLVSLAGLAGAVLVGCWLVARATGQRWLPLVVPVLFLARYFDVNSFYDHARADNLMALFAAMSVAALCLRRTRVLVPLFVVSGLLAFWTKQSSVGLSAVLLLGYALINWRVALLAGIALFGLIFGTYALANAATGGWLYAYTIDAPSYHVLDYGRLLRGLRVHMLGSFGVASVLTGLAGLGIVVSGNWPKRDWDDRARTRYMVVVSGIAAGGFTVASLSQPVSVENVLVLYAVFTAIVVPVVLSWGIERLAAPVRRHVAWNMALVLLALVVLQGFQNPHTFHPKEEDAAQWRRLETDLAGYGPRERVWVTLHGSPWGGALNRPTSVHVSAMCDFVGGYFGRPTPYSIPEGLIDRIEAQYWDVVVVKGWDETMVRMLAGRYEKDPDNDGLRLPAFAGYGGAWEEYWIRVKNPGSDYQRPSADEPCATFGQTAR